MFRNRLIQHGLSGSSSSSSFWSLFNDEPEDETCSLEEIQTRLVWVTNYNTDEDFPINVSTEDPLEHYFVDPSPIDLSKFTLNELLILLYHFQQQQGKTADVFSRQTPITDRSAPLSRRLSNRCFANLADAPKELTPTLIQSLSSVHSPTHRPIHSPNDVVTKLEQTLQMQEAKYHRLPPSNSTYSYHQSQEHKAKVISNLLASYLSHR